MGLQERQANPSPGLRPVVPLGDEAQIGPAPIDLGQDQWDQAQAWWFAIERGAGLWWDWPTLRRLTGRLLPGWLVVIGARPECGKTTLCLTQAVRWAEAGRTVCYIGTETSAAVLRIQASAIRLGLPVARAVQGELPAEDQARVARDVAHWASVSGKVDKLLFAEAGAARLEDALYWLRWAADQGAEAVIFDHFHGMSLTGGSQTGALDEAVRALNVAATDCGVTLLLPCQFNRGQGGGNKLALHEIPDDAMFRGTDALLQFAVVALQLWRPIIPGISPERRKGYAEGTVPRDEVVQADTMALRVAKHRYLDGASGQMGRLRIHEGVIAEGLW